MSTTYNKKDGVYDMKKMYRISLAYLVFGLIAGLVNHEVAYWTQFSGESVMSVVHPHAILLGGGVFLILPLLMKNFPIEKRKSFRMFLWTYNVGLIMTLGFMTARGMSELLVLPFPSFWDHMVGGLAGIGHTILTIGIGFLFHALIKSADTKTYTT